MLVGDIKAALLKEFVEVNSLPFDLDVGSVDFGDAYESISSDCNTAMYITINSNNVNYKGTQRLRYNRYALDVVYREIIVIDPTVSFDSTLELVEYLIDTLGLPLDQTVFKDTVIVDTDVTVTLEVISSNRYLPNTSTVVVFKK